ncbi:Abi family protein [Staphylococcus epidermidis]
MDNNVKPMLNPDELINKLKTLGIRFNIVEENQAKNTLTNKTYYFKLGYFRTNFPKKNDRYNIEFAYLSDLASIDMNLRYLLMKMCLDIEHIIKTIILHNISVNQNEDGYTIMNDFYKNDDQKKRTFRNVMKKETIKDNGKVTKIEVPKEDFKKYYDNPPIWVCLELMSYNQFNEFVHFYQSRIDDPDFKLIIQCIDSVRKTRNLSAHNQPILVNLNNPKLDSTKQMMMHKAVELFDISYRQTKLLPVRSIISVFLLHYTYCHSDTKTDLKNNLSEFKHRMNLHKNYYTKQKYLNMTLNAINKIIDVYMT